jgi:hypothetical protein
MHPAWIKESLWISNALDPSFPTLGRSAIGPCPAPGDVRFGGMRETIGTFGKMHSISAHDAVRKGLQTRPGDREKMPTKADFYVAQLTMFHKDLLYIQAV